MDIDWATIALQAVNVLILLWLLQRFLYRPVLAVLDRRRQEIEAGRAAVEAARGEAERARAAADQERTDLARRREQLLIDAAAEADRLRQQRLGEAQKQSEQWLEEARRRLCAERRQAEQTLREQAAQLAAEFAGRVLRGVPSSALLRGYLDEMSEQAQALREAGGTRVRVRTATPLSDAECGAVTERIGALAGRQLEWLFEVDPDLIAGIELHFDGVVIARTVAQDLARLKAASLET